MLISLGSLLAGQLAADLVAQTGRLAAIVGGIFGAWCLFRLKPLGRYALGETQLAQRPLLTVFGGFLAVLFAGGMWSAIRTGEPLHGRSLSAMILIALTTGAPLAAAYWMDRYGKRAVAHRRSVRASRPSA